LAALSSLYFLLFDLRKDYRGCITLTWWRGSSPPASIGDGTINSIKSRFEDDCVSIGSLSFESGQAVRIQGGFFEGLGAIFEREMTPQQRIILLLNTLLSQFRVDVDREYVALE